MKVRLGKSTKGKFAILSLLALMCASFFAVFSPGHALNVTVNASVSVTCAAPNCNGLLTTPSLAVTAIGDVIVVTIGVSDGGLAGTSGPQVSSITDTQGNVYTLQAKNPVLVGASCAAGECVVAEQWTATAISTAGDVLTVLDGPASSATAMLISASDVSGIGPTFQSFSVGTCTTGGCLTSTTATTSTSSSFGYGTVAFASMGIGSGVSSAGTGYTQIGTLNAGGTTEYSLTVASPTSFPFTKTNGGATFYSIVGVIYAVTSQPATTSTTVINTMCLGPCSSVTSANSTAKYLTTNTLIFQSSQNVATAATVDNVTVKVSAVHINAASGTIYVITCVATTSTSPPGSGNLYSCFNPYTVTVVNGSTSFFIHANPQTQICATCYYAVGIMPITTKSNSASVTGSGIQLFETSAIGFTQYSYAVGSSTPPVTFFSSTANTPRYYLYIHTVFPTAITTTTTTSTLTGTFTNTVTTTSTSVVTTIDATFFAQQPNLPFIFLILLLPTGLLLGVTRNIDGGIVGLAIGAVMGVMFNVIPAWVFTGLVIAIVGIAFVVHRANG